MMLSHNKNNRDTPTSEDMPGREESEESGVKTENEGLEKSNRKRKRKGLGNWTRTTLACNRCRKMKIRCDDARPCSNCKRWSYNCITTQTDASQTKTNDSSAQDSLRKRIQRIEILLHGTQPSSEPQQSISSALAGIEKLLGIPPLGPSEQTKNSIITPVLVSDPTLSPTTLPSPAGSQSSQLRTAFLAEANHKRWGAESAIGQSWSKISAMDPRLQTLSNTLGLPGADEMPKPADTQRRILADFPQSEYAMELFNAYMEYVAPIHNIIHPPTVRTLIETVSTQGPQTLHLAEQFLLFMVFALGSLIKNDGKSETFYKQASSAAFEVLSETSTESATCAFLLGLYQQTTGRISAAWTMLGVVVRIAQALGYHRNVSHWGLSAFHQEFRRRIWANIYILDAYQSVVYGRPPIIQDAECDVDPPTTSIDDADMAPDMPVPLVSDGRPKQMDFHLSYYKLCRITHKMMKRLYLNVESKFDTWETIRGITEQLQEFRVSLPRHLRIESVESNQGDSNILIQRQAIFLDLFISHTLNICCRPLLVHRQPNDVSPAVAKHRRNYCQDVAVTASNHLASVMDYRHKCGFLARMLFSASGVFLTAAEVLALHAIVAPKDSPAANEAWKNINKLLALFAYSDRAGPFTAQAMSILQDLVRLVVRINEEKKSGSVAAKSIPPSPKLGELGVTVLPIEEDLFPAELLNDFLNQDPFPNLAMDDMIWMPEKSMSSVWGNMGEWRDFI